MKVVVPAFCVVFLSMICLSQGNWYGKRGSEVDDAFQRYLEGRITKTTHQTSSDRELIYKILQLLKDWQLKQKAADPIVATSFDQK